MKLPAFFEEDLQLVDTTLEKLLPGENAQPASIHEAMRYSVFAGGKRIRPILCVETARIFASDITPALHPACAIEFIHTYSLIHDDLPALDNDDLRRGKPTCHKAFDEATAVLAGDALQALAFEILTDRADTRRLAMMHLLTRAIGSHGMAGGQAIDLAAVGQTLTPTALEDMHRRKTGALIHASVMFGAIAAEPVSPATREALDGYGRAIGLAFQIVDDLLDVEGETSTLGKTSGADAARGKPTYPSVLGIAGARARARELHAAALESLAPLGDNGRLLSDLATYIIERTQ